MKKVLYTLNVDNYAPDIVKLTYPLLQIYADKIGAEFYVISERKFPDFPPVYEKFQIYELGKDNDWNIFFDSDAVVHPDLFDITELINKDTILGNVADMANNRFKYDDYFRRDGRNIGCGNWFSVVSNWCLDYWQPLNDLTLEEAVSRITPIQGELCANVQASHLIDDFVVSRNVARYGLKRKVFSDLLKDLNCESHQYLWHAYAIGHTAKLKAINEVLEGWKLKI